MFLPLLLIGVFLYFAWDGRIPRRESDHRGDASLDTLRERYARGEIDEATYDRMRDKLGRK
jgi:uncharacterized membrane protein